MTHSVMFTLRSRNSKTGSIPVSTTSMESCPPACPLQAAGCYAMNGKLGMIWRALSATRPGRSFRNGAAKVRTLNWSQFVREVRALPAGQLWRHDQAGDLPGVGNAIDREALGKLVAANAQAGARGFTYTHKPLTRDNRRAIRGANAMGFTINLSANNLVHADLLANANVGPVVTILPSSVNGHMRGLQTPQGRPVTVCPATYREDITCESCQLCQRQAGRAIVGFPAHGAQSRAATAIANQ